MSTYYQLVCDKHKAIGPAVFTRTTTHFAVHGDMDELINDGWLGHHIDCEPRLLDEHKIDMLDDGYGYEGGPI